MRTDDRNKTNRTLLVGPSLCIKPNVILKKLQLFRLNISEQKIRFITRSPEQYIEAGFAYTNIEDVSVDEDLEDRTTQDFQNCCVVFDVMFDSNKKLKDRFFTRGRQNDLDVYCFSQSVFDFKNIVQSFCLYRLI